VIWCTNDALFVFVVMDALGIRVGGGWLKAISKEGSRSSGPKIEVLLRPPEECGVTLSSITFLGNSECFVKSLGDQGSGRNIYGSMVQKIWTKTQQREHTGNPQKNGYGPLNNKTYLITLWVGKIAKSLTVGIFSRLSPPPERLWLDRVEVPMLPTGWLISRLIRPLFVWLSEFQLIGGRGSVQWMCASCNEALRL